VNYYNDNDPKKTAWLETLIEDRIIPPGHIDRRSIKDVCAGDLKGYRQHHFFAGVGGWPLALALAGIDRDEPVATCSCPCQPWSQTGLGLGFADPRHLWPEFFRIARDARFPRIFGEQVSSKAGIVWLNGIRVDLEDAGYLFDAADLCAAGVSAPQPRQRLYWVAYADSARPQGRRFTRHRTREESPWSRGVGLRGRSGKVRRIEPGIEPLVDGFPERMALIGGAGDAIVSILGAEFIQACEEARHLEMLGV
jgi:DNA (cytosine-5)-methyltransferase 1